MSYIDWDKLNTAPTVTGAAFRSGWSAGMGVVVAGERRHGLRRLHTLPRRGRTTKASTLSNQYKRVLRDGAAQAALGWQSSVGETDDAATRWRHWPTGPARR